MLQNAHLVCVMHMHLSMLQRCCTSMHCMARHSIAQLILIESGSVGFVMPNLACTPAASSFCTRLITCMNSILSLLAKIPNSEMGLFLYQQPRNNISQIRNKENTEREDYGKNTGRKQEALGHGQYKERVREEQGEQRERIRPAHGEHM